MHNSFDRQEMNVIKKTFCYKSFNFNFFFVSSRLVFLAILIPYITSGQTLTAEAAFFTLSLFNTVRLSMTLFFPNAISFLSEALVSVKRIQDFLLLEEIDEIGNSVTQKSNSEDDSIVNILDLCAKWDKEETSDTLKNISLEVKSGELLGIIGSVGSGKGSILQAILGEIPTHSGKVKVSGSISYASQEPWVFSGSVRHNIIFGEKYEDEKYWKVIEVCALEHDIANWEHGDDTLVGEKGVSLSGGQVKNYVINQSIILINVFVSLLESQS